MKWRFTDDQPLYLQAASLIRGAVFSGEFPPGGRIPSVRELAAQAQINPNTMQRAMAELEHEMLVISCGTAGKMVTDDEAVLGAVRENMLRELARSCVEKFAAFGVSPAQAAEILGKQEWKEEA